MLGWMTTLADPVRARLLRSLESHELTVAELCSVVQLPQSTTSRHLKVLADDGWVVSRREGTSRLYTMRSDGRNGSGGRLWQLLREQFDPTSAAAQDDKRLSGVLARRRARSQEFFASEAGRWDKLRGELFGHSFDHVGLLGLLDESWAVGDLGCGTAQLAGTIAPFVRRVIAVDESTVMLRHAQRRIRGLKNVETRRGDLAALPIRTGELDVAVLSMVLHHIPEPPVVLRGAARALKPGGKLLLIDLLPHDREEYRRRMGHVWLGFEPRQIETWLRDTGFRNPRLTELPVDPEAKGPALFAATARRTGTDLHEGHDVTKGTKKKG